MDGCSGPVNTFIVEPFVPHDAEYYLCVQSKRLGDDISFSDAGGIEIEANWDSVQTVRILQEFRFPQIKSILASLSGRMLLLSAKVTKTHPSSDPLVA